MIPYLTDGLHAHIIFCPRCQSNNQHTTNQLYYSTGGNYRYEVPFVRHVCTMCSMMSYDYYKEDKSSCKYNFYRIIPQGAPVNIPQPNPDLPKTCQSTYTEAAHVFEHSPRSAAVLLRLCLQQLLEHLGFKGTIFNMIAEATTKLHLPEHIQQFMDVTRHYGNEAAHESELTLNLEEQQENVQYMFEIINEIAQHSITIPKKSQQAYNRLPENVRKSIEKRNTQTLPPAPSSTPSNK